MKILFVSNLFPPETIGGAEIVAYEHALSFYKKGYQVVIITATRNGFYKPYQVVVNLCDGLKIYRIKLPIVDLIEDSENFKNDAVDSLFEKVISQEKPDIVHAHNLAGLSVNIGRISRINNIPSFITLHDYWAICPKNTLRNSLGLSCNHLKTDRFCIESYSDGIKRVPIIERHKYIKNNLSNFDVLISPSQYLANEFIKVGYPKNKFIILSNGIKTEVSNDFIKKKKYFLCVGYLGWHKGFDQVIKAAYLLKRKGITTKLLIAGDGEEMNNLKLLVNCYGLKPSVKFLGKIYNDAVRALYSESIALISCSRWPENQPVSFLEAYSYKTPVIAPKIGGIPEIVKNNQTGLLYKSESAKELSACIQFFLNNMKLAESYGKNGFKLVTNSHSHSKTIDSLELIYNQCINNTTFK